MAKIPDISPSFASLGELPAPVSSRDIVKTDLSAPANAIAHAGEVAGDTVNYLEDQQGKTDVAFAKSNYLQSMTEVQKAEENNPDWQGAPDRWKAASKQAYENAAGSVQDPRFRAQFESDAAMETNRQYSNFLQNNDVKRKQDGLSRTMQASDNNMSVALSAPDDTTAQLAINNTNELIDSSVKNGFISPVEGYKQRKEWVQDYGKKKVDQFLANGDAEGAKDWLNKHHDMLNPTQDDINKVNTAVTLPRATGTTDAIVNGAPIANSEAISTARRKIESNNQQFDKAGNTVMGPMTKTGEQAVGISQILPSTAREVAGRMGVAYDPEKLKTDKAYNQMLGDAYQNEMIARYNGNQTLAMAAYNAGPANVDKWIEQNGDPRAGQISDQDFINKIPFKETKNYVSFINGKVPPIPGVVQDSNDPTAAHASWMETASKLPESISPLVKTGIQARINDGEQQRMDIQTMSATTMADPILQGKITDPSQLAAPNMQSAWANAQPELQKSILGALREGNKEKTEYGPKFWELYKAVHAPDGDPTKITDPTKFYQYGDGNGLTLNGIQKLTDEVTSKKTQAGAQTSAMQAQTFKVLKTQLSGEDQFPGMKDPKGEEIFAQAMPMVYKAITDGEAKGIPSSELYDPSNKNWVGNVAKGLIRSPDQWHADITGANLSDETAPDANKSGFISRWFNPLDNSIENEAKAAAFEEPFKAGNYSKTPQAKAQGLASLKDALAKKTITPDKFKEMAVTYGYARGSK